MFCPVQGLAQFGGLQALSLYSNAISDVGVSELAEAAAAQGGGGRGALRSLELRGNPRIGAGGARALLAAAQGNDSLLEARRRPTRARRPSSCRALPLLPLLLAAPDCGAARACAAGLECRLRGVIVRRKYAA